ncbi:MAG TPA: LysM peptidoglycan-binding domain-containing protein [Smithella sp.]|nr:LysM peptidoglycan-binding domain-containing protein [Smithella sp.]
MMIKRYVFVLVFVFFSFAFIYPFPTVSIAQEDTAQLKLKKTAIPTKKLYTYTVKKGDVLSTIIKSIPGITEEDVSKTYQMIKELNPNIPDLDNLEAGQSLILPGKPLMGAENNEDNKTAVGHNIASTGIKYYLIKRGDTLFKIIRRELKNEKDIEKTLKTIKSMNPGIKNVNRIYAGAVIRLPGKTLYAKIPEEIKPAVAAAPEIVSTPEVTAAPTVEATPEVAAISQKSNPPEKIVEIKEKIMMPPEARLAVLKQVITQMNGSMITTGNYYLPIPKAGQVTIDCSLIPLIEFDDNTIVFVDMENHTRNNLKRMISDTWSNFYLIKVDKNDDIITILRKIINRTKNYRMAKSERPLTVGAVPPVEVMVDWVIEKSVPHQQPQTIQGLRSIYDNNLLLPSAVKNYCLKNGLTITEISNETGLVGKPEEAYSLPPMPVLPVTSAKDFSYALVTFLGLHAEKDVDVQLFNTAKDGFDLSIKADVLVKNEDKKYIIYSQTISQQFLSALRQTGNELILVKNSNSPKYIMENILRGINIPFTSDRFTFSGASKNQAPYTLKFSGTKIKTNQDLYVIDFDIDQQLRGLLQEVWSVNIARY